MKESTMKSRTKILIVGGYGNVGHFIVAELAKDYSDDLIIAGRDLLKAQATAKKFGDKVSAKVLDVNCNVFQEEAFSDVKLVIMCIDQQNTAFVEFCINQGINYIDITASYEFISQLEKLHSLAAKNKSSVILSVGIAPGLTNLLAKLCKQNNELVKFIDIYILLGSGGKHGDAAYRWLLKDINDTFILNVSGESVTYSSFTKGKSTTIADEVHTRTFYRSNFSDQHVIPQTLNINSASTYLCFDSKLLTNLIVFLKWIGISKLLKIYWFQWITIKLFTLFNLGSEAFFIKVVGKDSNGKDCASSFSLTGVNEGKVTASVASQLAQIVIKYNVKHGVHHIENVVQPKEFIDQLDVDLVVKPMKGN